MATANNRRDVEFIIRARDLSSRTFREVAGSVDGLTSSLDKQIAAAERGELSAQELRNAYRQLNEAGRALLGQQGLIDYQRKVADSLELAEGKARGAREAHEALKTTLAGSETVTKAQERELAKLARAEETAEKRATTLRDSLDRQNEKLKQAGIDTKNLAGEQRRLVQVAEQVGDALGKTQGALDGYDANLRRVKQSQQELAKADDLAAFRQIGAAAEQNAQKVNQGRAAFDQYGEAADSVASRLRRIVDPSRAAGESLEGLAGEVARLDGVVGVADKPIREYQDAIYDLGQVQRSILSQASAIDNFRQQEAAVERASAAVERARADVVRYAQAVQTADEPNQELVRSLRQAEAALSAENRELDNQNRKLASLSGNLKRAGIDTKNLAAAERTLEAASNTSAAALTRLDNAAAGKNTRSGRFLGLRAYELQNLSFQINDVFTQIASGTSVTQTLAQQGGQIFQIFPRAFGAIAAFLPELAAVAAVFISIGAAIKNAADEAESTRQFAGALELMADGSEYSAAALAETAHELDVFGGSLEDARKEVQVFLKAGLDPAMFERFGKAAQNTADVTGKDLPEAAKEMADAFSRGYEAVAKLDDEINFLSASEREHIRIMFESGDASGARLRAFELYERAVDRAAEKARGPWDEAFRNAARLWDNFLDRLGNSKPIQEAISLLDQLAEAAERATGGGAASGDWGLPGGVQRQKDISYRGGDEFVRGQPVGPYTDQWRGLLNSLTAFDWTQPTWMGGQPGATAQGDIVLTDELRDVAAMAYLEAINDPQAQRDVAAVIVNRTRASGQNASQVIRAPGQFEPYSARRDEFNRVRADDDRVYRILSNILPILEGRVADPTRGATLFVSPGGQAEKGRQMPAWADPANMTLNRHGHQFYTGRFPGDRRGGDTVVSESEARAKAGAEVLRELEREIALRDKNNHALRLEEAERRARQRVQDAGGDDASADQAGALARADEQRKINEEVAREAEQASRRTEAENNRLKAMADSLRNDLRSLETRAQRVQDSSLESRLAAIDTQFSGIERNLQEAEAAGVRQVDGQTLEQVRARIDANKTILKQQEQMAYYEDQVKALEEQRASRLSQIADQAAAGNIEIDEAFRQALAVNAELAPKIEQMAKDAVAFALAIRGAEPNETLDAFIANMGRVVGREERPGTTGPVANAGRDQLQGGQAELNNLIAQRNELVANYARLVELGTITQQEGQERTKRAYEATQPAIIAQVEEIIRLAEAMRAAGTLTAAEFERIRATLEVTSLETQYLDANLTRVRSTIEEGLGQAAIGTLNGLAASIAGLIDGTMSWGEAFDGIWDAARNGVADLLSGIAQVLMQIAIMQAIKNIPFLNSLSGGLLDIAGLTVASTTLASSGAVVNAGAATLTAAATTLGLSATPLMAAAGALTAAAAAMTSAAYLQMAANATGGGIFHSGGIVGSSSQHVSRKVSSLAWVGAPRHHSGALVGLKSDEHAAILQRGEEVLAKNDPRNALNGGAALGGSGAPSAPPILNAKIVNLLRGADVLAEGLSDREGQQVFMNFIGRNRSAIKAKLGV